MRSPGVGGQALEASTRSTGRGRIWLGAGVLLAITLVCYWPVKDALFVWDDDRYVTGNATLRDAAGLRRIWLEIGATPQYYPLVHTSFWLEYQIWQLEPRGYHLVNVALHALNAILVWILLARLGVPGAWLAAALFALHPVHVESVAWVTERKNVLSGFFYLLSMLAYLGFAPPAGREEGQRARPWLYTLSIVLFVLALLAKTVTASLPVAILLVVWWQRGRLSREHVLRVAPMLLLGLGFGLLTAWMEKVVVGASGIDWTLSFVERGLLAGRALWFYVGKLLWPTPLVFVYPRWVVDDQAWWQYLFPLAAGLAFVALWLWRDRVGRGPLAAALFFALTLAPALGFVDVFPMRYSYVADHFQYLASLGILVAAAALASRVLTPRRSLAAATVVSLVLLGGLTFQRSQVYRDVETLWRDTLARNPKAWMAHDNLGALLAAEGRVEEAREHFATAARLVPEHANARYNHGLALALTGRTEEARAELAAAVRLAPTDADSRQNLAAVLLRSGDPRAAIGHYRIAVGLEPERLEVRYRLAGLLFAQCELAAARDHLLFLASRQPENARFRLDLERVAAGCDSNQLVR